MDEYEIQERRQAFNQWLRMVGKQIGYYSLPANLQGQMHEALRKAFNAGQRFRFVWLVRSNPCDAVVG